MHCGGGNWGRNREGASLVSLEKIHLEWEVKKHRMLKKKANVLMPLMGRGSPAKALGNNDC